MAGDFWGNANVLYCPGCSPNDALVPHICGYGQVSITDYAPMWDTDQLNRLLEIERKLDRVIDIVERLERWFGPEFDEEGNVVK